MSDVQYNESGNRSIIDQEKQDAAHQTDSHFAPGGEKMDVDEVIDDLANDVTETANLDKPSGRSGL